jgi:hypothetical protein
MIRKGFSTLAGGLLLASVLVSSGALAQASSQPTPASGPVVVTTPGQLWRAHVQTGGVGYILKSYKPGQAMPGAPGTAVFGFHAGVKGKTTIVFTYARASGAPAQKIEMTIDAQ